MKTSREDLCRIVQVMCDLADHKVKECERQRAHMVSKLETLKRLYPAREELLSGFEASANDAALRVACIRLITTERSTSAAMLDARRHYAKLIYLTKSR